MDVARKKEVYLNTVCRCPLTLGAKVVASYFYLRADNEVCNASYSEIANFLDMSRNGVINAVSELCHYGFLLKLQDVKGRKNFYSVPDPLPNPMVI